MTTDPAFARRVARLSLTSAVALGLVWLLAAATLRAHAAIGACLAGGWLLMPTILWLSLRWPRLRYALILPSTLVSASLVAICATALPRDAAARGGWLMLTAGILLGGALGIWLWLRWIPVPARLSDPFCRGRWLLILVHVLLVVAGLALIGVSAAAGRPI